MKSAVDCLLNPPGGGGGGGRLELGGAIGATPGMGGGARLLRLFVAMGDVAEESPPRGDSGGDRVGSPIGGRRCEGIGTDGASEIDAVSRFPPDISSSDCDPSVCEVRLAWGGGGGGRAIQR